MQNDQPIPYLQGMPLVACSPLSESERSVLRGRAASYARRLVPIGIAGAMGGLLLIQLIINSVVYAGVYFVLLVVLALGLAIAWVRHDHVRRLYTDAASASQRLVFRGQRRRFWMFGRRTEEVVVVTPGWIALPSKGGGGVRACRMGSVAYTSPARREANGSLTPNEYDELLFRTDRLLSLGVWRALFGCVLCGYLFYAASQMSLPWYGVLLFGLGSLFGLHSLREGWSMFRLGLKMDADCQRGAVLTTISATSPGLAHASLRYPILERSLSRVEFLPCGVVWSLDGKPAPWRLRGNAPDFVPPSALVPPALLVRRP